jgi:RNA polymerase sigma factor (sigma-70 family)
MGREGALWREQSIQVCTGPLPRMLRARPGDMQAQGRASKPSWPPGRGVHGDKPLSTLLHHLRAILPELFLRRAISPPTLLTNVPLKAWLFRVARNRCLDEPRRRRRRAEIPFSTLAWEYSEEDLSPIEANPDPDPLPEEVAECIDLYCSLQEAIASLHPKFRPIAHLRCFRQLTFAEIGRLLNMPETTAKTYFYRSLPRLRRALASSVHIAAVS